MSEIAVEKMTREARLRCMATEHSSDGSPNLWGLNEEDRGAIQWAFDRIKTLENDLVRSRSDQIDILKRGNAILNRIKEIQELCASPIETVN